MSRQTFPGIKRRLLRSQQGSSLVELALVVPALLMLLVGAVDFGHGYYLAIEMSSAAQAAALYGTQNPTDTAGMTNLASLNAQDVSNLNVAAVNGCECSDGSASSVNCIGVLICTANTVRFVDVTITGTFVPLLSFPGVNTNIALRAHQKMRSTTGL